MVELASGSDGAQGSQAIRSAWVPDRVKNALADAADFACFRRRRVLRLFSRKNDSLGSRSQGCRRHVGDDICGLLKRVKDDNLSILESLMLDPLAARSRESIKVEIHGKFGGLARQWRHPGHVQQLRVRGRDHEGTDQKSPVWVRTGGQVDRCGCYW